MIPFPSVLRWLYLPLCLYAVPLSGQFHLNGEARMVNDSCFLLTDELDFTAGSMWNPDKISLDESFQVIMELFLGCKDQDGADGIVFGFQPVSTSLGQNGGGIGFQNIVPSLGIEFDTWRNPVFNDPVFDHVAIIRDGNLDHSAPTNLAGPVQMSASSPNVEDCNWHELRVNWDVETLTLEVWFDCQLRLSYTGDIVNDIFGGDPLVFWGFTSATGGFNNKHEVCFSYTTFLDGFEDVTICPGGQFQLNVSGGVRYEWTPADGLSNPRIPNPIAAPDSTTTYSVLVIDDCNNPFTDTITVFVDGDTVFFELGNDTTLCQGQPLRLDATSFGDDTVTYRWNTGATTPTLTPTRSGRYSVTVTVDEFCVADDRIRVEFIPLPSAALPPDTTFCLGDSLWLASSFPDATITWQDGSQTDSFLVLESGTYAVTVSNPCGEAESSIDVLVEDCEQVFFPNVFSPDGDGINDRFHPLDGGDVEIVEIFQVFDRWGGLVHEAKDFLPNDPQRGWDGRVGGRDAVPGVYVWWARVRFRNGVEARLEGDVLLIR